MRRILFTLCVVTLLLCIAGGAVLASAAPKAKTPLQAQIEAATLHDYSTARGFEEGYFFQIDITLTEAFTSQPQWSYFTEEVLQYMELNGVNLKDRYEHPERYHVVITDAGYYGGQSVVVQNYAANVITLLMIGGGTGAPQLNTENTLTLKQGFPLENGILKEDIQIQWDPERQAWGTAQSPIPVLDAEWTRTENNLITNFYSMYQPEVVYVPEWDDDEHYPYLMYFFAWAYNQENDKAGDYPGYPGGDAIFVARAKAVEGPWEIYAVDRQTNQPYWDKEQNPFTWEPVIVCGNTWYDSWHIGDPSVVYMDGTFYMAMSSMGADADGIPTHQKGDTDGNASCILGATSTDGITWTKSAEPLLVWEGEKGYKEGEAGALADWGGGHQRPSILFEDGKWKMWFDWKENQYGYAECEAGVANFTDSGKWHEIYGFENPYPKAPLNYVVDFDVVKVGDTYYGYGDPYLHWYGITDETIQTYPNIDGTDWASRQIVEYQSTDGINWKVTGYFRPDAGYDANQIPQIFHDEKNNRLCLFYATQRGIRHGEWGEGTYDWRWDNIRVMIKRLGPSPVDPEETKPAVTEPVGTEPAITESEITKSEGTGAETASPEASGADSRETSAGGHTSGGGCACTIGFGASMTFLCLMGGVALCRKKKDD